MISSNFGFRELRANGFELYFNNEKINLPDLKL